MILEKIQSPDDVKVLSNSELHILAQEMRTTLIEKTSICGGHLGSNLGLVEITIALHYVFNSPFDKMVFDVSHQTYCHKMLTGRQLAFTDKEHYDDVIGFSNPEESKHDWFNMGHTSTSISLACGFAKARDLIGSSENVIAVIGDGSLGGGQAFEGLNYAAEQNSGLIIIVNDNDMSIAENHGGLYTHLKSLRDSKGKAENNIFIALGMDYYYIEDGNNLYFMIDILKKVKGTKKTVVIHVWTKKGKGYTPAEENKEDWHWSRPFNIETGVFKGSDGIPIENYGAIACSYLIDKMKQDPKVVVVTAATPICIGFNEKNRIVAGKQFVDVGIMEQHAVSMVTAIARAGGKPVFATNSTFIQRAYDQIEHELCITKCPATLIVTHASVSAHNNITHSGLLDIAMLSNIPNLVYLAPTNKQEYLNMLDWSIEQNQYPVAIRVPWNGVYYSNREVSTNFSDINHYEVVRDGSKVAILALGGFYQLGEAVAEKLKESGVNATLINPRYITGVDKNTLESLERNHSVVATIEDGVLIGGFGAKIAQFFANKDVKVKNFGFSQGIPICFDSKEMIETNRLTSEEISADIIELL
ncbi:1-deoxy-D-xylulose-5-phosphate synthase [Bacteroides fragilis]|uniref:1-deoxy-D-xylulose-5-phosphate synthase n=1 Tax=Bacteroides fragilis TaxID=817 RepID=A0ABD4VYN2_BACFG|nr:1-deoxy-D-xylulose-5-phosphate synthase [Bacteroides fragilis]MCZ2656563.1 1-deoxy-D-xylulose-5-phosphate synthase [Bacteroides fragilis]